MKQCINKGLLFSLIFISLISFSFSENLNIDFDLSQNFTIGMDINQDFQTDHSILQSEFTNIIDVTDEYIDKISFYTYGDTSYTVDTRPYPIFIGLTNEGDNYALGTKGLIGFRSLLVTDNKYYSCSRIYLNDFYTMTGNIKTDILYRYTNTNDDIIYNFLLNDVQVHNETNLNVLSGNNENYTKSHNITEEFIFNSFEICAEAVTQDDYYIQQINFTNIYFGYNSSNNLPTCNFNIQNTTICYEELFEDTIINYDISCNDIEGDTILYSENVNNYFNEYSLYYQNFFHNEECQPDYPFFQSYNYYSNYSTIDNPIESIAYKTYILGFNNHMIDSFIEDGICYGEIRTTDIIDSWTFLPNQRYSNDVFTTLQGNFYYEGINLEIIYYDKFNNIIMNATFNTTDNNLTSNFNNIDIINTNFDFNEDWYLFIDFNQSQNKSIVKFWYNEGIEQNLFYEYDLNFTDFSHITFNTKNTPNLDTNFFNKYWGLHEISISGYQSVLNPIFTSTLPTTYSVESYGDYEVTIYVTDSVNTGQSFNTYTQSFSVTNDISMCNFQDIENIEDNIIRKTLSGFFTNFLDDIGASQYFYNIFWLLFLILFLFGILLFKDIVWSITVTSFFMCFLAFIGFGNNMQFLSTGVIFIFTISKPLTRLIL